MRNLVVFALLTSTALAQGVLPIAATYRFGTLNTGYDGNCTPPNPTVPELCTSQGTLTLGIDGRYVYAATEYVVCPSGQVLSFADSGNGRYFVEDDGRLTFDEDGAAPGFEVFTLFLRSDASVAATTRKACDDEPELVVMVALSSGHSNASLTGAYRVVRLVLSNGATHTAHGDLGTITFDGSGGYTETSNRRSVVLNGGVTSGAQTPSGTYQVANDGALTTGATGWGAVSPDREMFFWSRAVGTEVELTLGVRTGTAYASRLVDGRWGTNRLAHAVGFAAPVVGALVTEYGTVELTAGTGNLQWEFERVETRPQTWPYCDRHQQTGGFALGPTGALTLSPAGVAAVDGGVSSDGSLFLARTADPGSVGIELGISRCAWPRRFGQPTAGTGGFAPSLFSVGGFPHVGNAVFSLAITGGLGGAPGAVLTSLGDAPGLPLFGGTVWIDPTRIVLQFPVTLSGPGNIPGVGAAGMFLPLPSSPSAAGVRLVSQAFLFDAGAPAGVSMTPGLDVMLVR